METPDVIDLRKVGRKEPEKQLYQVDIMNCCALWFDAAVRSSAT